MKRNSGRLLTVFTLATVLQVSQASAHEYWVEPHRYAVEPGEQVTADLKNGQNFKGARYPYVTKYFEFFTINTPRESEPVPGRDGDTPPLDTFFETPGLYSVSYQSNFDKITFRNEEKIRQYFDYEGLTDAQARHAARGLAADQFEEHYARCAKALIQVGAPTVDQRDRLTGMKFEIVAEANPYTLSQSDTLPVSLYWEGKPASDVQIRWFRAIDESETGTVRTDAQGRAEIPLTGGGKFLLNAVRLLEGDEDPESETPEWYSYWASLTFGIQGTDAALAAARAN